MRARYSSGKTFFAADIVWECARAKGVYKLHVPIPGFVSPFIALDVMTEDVVRHPIVMLGRMQNGSTHAIALRNGVIYDSERIQEGPRLLTKPELKKSLVQVFGAYAFLHDPNDAVIIRRAASIMSNDI